MTEWQVIELVGDRKPPYDWKHGWIPVSAKAKAIAKARKEAGLAPGPDMPSAQSVAKAKSATAVKDKPSSGGKLTVDQALADPARLPPALRNPNLHKRHPGGHRGAIADYLEKNPDGFATPSKPATKDPGYKAKPVAAKTEDADSLRHMSPHQTTLWEEVGGKDPGAGGVDAAIGAKKEWEGLDDAGELTPEQEEALEHWQFGEDEDSGLQFYQLLNQMKRSGKDLSHLDTDIDLGELDQAMESRLAHSKAARDVTLFRGIHHADDLQVGDSLLDPGWAATSYNPGVADSFSKSANGKMLVIHAPKGTPLIRLGDDMEEYEVLFGPNTPMRVTRVDGNRIHVRIEPRR